ncbi:OLC1v1007161C1 [Oldenlandia corymbosa var. corymbosa]|uniref:OLC1v1007161C1 n=1 Tax=Oldenlandia corymbosa var. corymbosa TaxID=529605 RepID=A0AAV1DLZ9_OLDCO|nr:OLC1v1007161C1 [Oldenlandia corymbosa var. corymbosa]
MAVSSPASVRFNVKRQRPVLVRPAKPTPHEIKLLSDIDDQHGNRYQVAGIHFFKARRRSDNNDDPVEVIKAAVAKALVFYYPLAGRLREGLEGKLMVACTGEGVLFIEADADSTMDAFGREEEEIRPPFPCVEELIPPSSEILHSPLFLIQLLTAFIWRGQIASIRPETDPTHKIRVLFLVNARSKFNPPIPKGYYGNVLATAAAVTTVGELTENPIEYAAELVKRARLEVTEEFMKSNADLLVLKGRPDFELKWTTHMVSDLTRAGFDEVDFGWGKPVYAGPAIGLIRSFGSFYIPIKNKNGEKSVMALVRLPRLAIERLVKEFETIKLKSSL